MYYFIALYGDIVFYIFLPYQLITAISRTNNNVIKAIGFDSPALLILNTLLDIPLILSFTHAPRDLLKSMPPRMSVWVNTTLFPISPFFLKKLYLTMTGIPFPLLRFPAMLLRRRRRRRRRQYVPL